LHQQDAARVLHALALRYPGYSAPHPCAFFLAQGWEATNPHQSLSSTPAPCPILSPSFWRKGGRPLTLVSVFPLLIYGDVYARLGPKRMQNPA
jgi:hypothetical protein